MSNKRRRSPPKQRTPARQDPPAVPEIRTVVVEQGVEAHYGPLPPPDVLDAYEGLFPGLAERIIRMAEQPIDMAQSQLAHRQTLEKRVITSDVRARWAGLIFGFLLCAMAIGTGGWLVSQGRSVEGLAAIITALGAPLSAFFLAEKRRRGELDRKNPFVAQR